MKQLSVTRWAPERVAGPFARATVEEGTTPEDFLQVEFWAHVAKKMRRFMRFEILDECGEWMADACVADCGSNWARVVVVGVVTLSGDQPEAVNPRTEFKVEYRAHDKYRIRRLSDNAIVATGIENKREAERRLDEHLKALAA